MVELTPYITVNGAADAIDFYTKAFGANEVERMPTEDGEKIMHAHLDIRGAQLMLSDAFPEAGQPAPTAIGGSSVALTFTLDTPEEVDAMIADAVAAGAEVLTPAADMFWGGRYGRIKDPFGHLWAFHADLAKRA